MRNACGVRSREAISDLYGDIDQLANRDTPSAQEHAQRFALDQLAYGIGLAIDFTEIEDRDDIRMIECSYCPCLRFEASTPSGLVGDVLA